MAQRVGSAGPNSPVGSLAPLAAGRAPRVTSARGRALRQNLIGWAFSLPFFLIFLVFMAGPIVASAMLSVTDFGLRDLRNPLGANVVGLQNYIDLSWKVPSLAP